MEEGAKAAIAKKVKDVIIKNIKLKAKIIIAIIIIIVLIILAGATYVVKRDDGSYKEDDWSSTPYGAGQYIGGVSVNDNGTLKNGLNAQELWDKMLEEGCRVDKYLSNPEELARLMKAEIVTQYPDTRPRDQLDTPIDWDKVIEEADTLQGIIKFKRADSDGNTSNLAYVDPTTFQSYIDEYNNTGSEAAKQRALSHFTLKKGNPSTSTIIQTSTNNKDKDNKEEDNEDKKDKESKEKENKNNKNKEKKQAAVETPVEGDGYSKEYTSSAGITYRHYKQGTNTTNGRRGSYCDNSYWSGTIATSGCGPTSVSILASGLMDNPENYTPGVIAAQMKQNYGLTSYATLQQQMNALGMMSVVVHSPSAEQIQENLRNGKVMLVSVNSATRFTGGSHIMALVDINEAGQVYICNPSNTGEGWFDISEIMKGCNYVVVTDAGATGIAPAGGSSTNGGTTAGASKSANYVAVVATWRQVDTTITTNDPNVEASSNTQYAMMTTDVNYEALVQPYTMPFDLLWALLVIGEDKNFIFELTDLVYGSDIQITIHDNLTENTIKEDWNYTKRTKAVVDAAITARCDGNSSTGSIIDDVHDPDSDENYNTTKTVVTKTNTLKTDLSRANVWIVDYKKDYTYQAPEETTSNNTVTKDNEEYPNEPESTGTTYSCEHIDNLKARLKERVIKLTEDNNEDSDDTSEESSPDVTYSETINVEYYSKYINIVNNITNTTKTQKYTERTPKVIEKTDEDTAPNFVTIFNDGKYAQNHGRIKDAHLWLFKIMEINPGTTNMIDMIKYLLYKATGSSYGVKEYKFSEYDGTTLIRIDGDYGDWDGTGTKEDFIKAVAPYAVIDMEQHQIYASVTIAQAIIESGWGKASIALNYKNYFGMKAFGTTGNEYWSGQSVALHASEGGISNFRVYDSLKNSIYDHGRNFHVTKTYATHGVLDCIPQNLGPKEQLRRIAISGYAVYRDGSIAKPDGKRTYDVYLYEGLIKPYNLEQYDTMKSTDFKQNKEGNTEIVKIAESKIGCPYVWGATGPDTFDCSGFVQWVYGQAGISLPRSTGDYKPYLGTSKEITWEEAKPGDIVWRNGHMGIYLGDDQYIHSPHTGDNVKKAAGAKSKFTNVFRFSE